MASEASLISSRKSKRLAPEVKNLIIMFFILSKTLNYLVMPLTMVAGCFVAAALLKYSSWRKRTFVAGLILLFLFTNEFISNELMKAWEVDATPFRDMNKYKVGIVLTGAFIGGQQPDDRVYFSRGADRVVHTVQLYKLGLIERILVSGGSGRIVDIGEREADKFRDAMILMGVPDSAIVLENTTRNTHESAIAVKELLRESGYDSRQCVLITSAFHMRRSLACYRKVGLHMDAFATDFYGHHGTYYPDSFLIPKIDALIIWHKLVREWVGFIAYWIAGYV